MGVIKDSKDKFLKNYCNTKFSWQNQKYVNKQFCSSTLCK